MERNEVEEPAYEERREEREQQVHGLRAKMEKGGGPCAWGLVKATPDEAGEVSGGHDLVVEATALPGLATQ